MSAKILLSNMVSKSDSDFNRFLSIFRCSSSFVATFHLVFGRDPSSNDIQLPFGLLDSIFFTLETINFSLVSLHAQISGVKDFPFIST